MGCMRWLVLLILIGLIGIGAYGYTHNPGECAKLGDDLMTDFPTLKSDLVRIFTSTTVTPDKPAKPIKPVTAPSATTAPEGWQPPSTIPAQADWTWTTSQGIFNNVHIVKVEPDCVTILHSGGNALVPIYELPTDLQRQLNYSPAAALAFAAQRPRSSNAQVSAMGNSPAPGASAQPLAQGAPTPLFTETTHYQDALAEAKRTNRKVLLHFTGSDWCAYCKMLDQEVLSRPEYNQFATANYITVTLDFPHDFPLADDQKQQNDALARKYNVSGYPTLVVIDTDEKELGRLTGYNPGSGPSAVISGLKAFTQ